MPRMTMRARRPGQKGLSLVELMVGITIGLLVVAASSLLVSSQLGENRRLLLETQVQQDLRASADIITRELRRAGYFSLAETVVSNPVSGPSSGENIYLRVGQSSACGGGGWTICFNYRRSDGGTGPFGYKLVGGVISTKLAGASGWQELTDGNTLIVTDLLATLQTSTTVQLPCPNLCPATGDTSCWPTIAVRDITVTIKGHAASDSAVERTVVSKVRLRNDQLLFKAGEPPAESTQACPSA